MARLLLRELAWMLLVMLLEEVEAAVAVLTGSPRPLPPVPLPVPEPTAATSLLQLVAVVW